MAFTKASMFIFFLMALVLSQQYLALGSPAMEDTQTFLDNLHAEQHKHRRGVMEEGTGQQGSSASSYIHDESPVFTSDGAPPSSDSMYLMFIGVFFAVAGLLRFAGLYFIGFMLIIGTVFVGIVLVSS